MVRAELGGWSSAALVLNRGGHAGHHHAEAALAGGTEGLLGLKLSLAVALCLFNALCWGLPLRFRRLTSSERSLGAASTFSGGVFLALAFCHMLPEAAGAFGASTVDSTRLACTFGLGGYLLVWGVERLAGGHSHDGRNPASAAIILGALSVHSILETMALAVARTKFAAGLLAGSIALHQPAESVALLVALVRAGLSGKRLLRLLLVFTAMGPIGSLAGLLLHGSFSATPLGPILDGALLALTAGTFIFVGATEVIPEEFEDHASHKQLKTAALAAGVVVMAALIAVADKLEHSSAIFRR